MKTISGPSSSSFIQLLNWIFRPLDYQEECRKKYGDTFRLNLMGLPPFTVVSDPQGVRDIFTADTQKFDVGRTNGLAGSLLGDNSLVLLDGVEHRRQRKLMMPPFHGEKVRSYAQTIVNIAEQEAREWDKEKPFIAQKAMQRITMETILHVVFGLSQGDRYQKLKPLLIELLDLTGSPLRASLIFLPFLQQDWGEWSPWGRVESRKRKIYQLLQAEIEDRRANPELLQDDVLSLMMSAEDEGGEGLSDIELKDQMMTLLVAGHETTATALSWALYWIHKLPGVKQKLLAELENSSDRQDLLAISRLPYLNAVCNETLRIYPVAFIAFLRVAKTPVAVMGQKLDPEAMFAPSIYLTHHSEDLYPEAKKFKPERFLERQYSPYEFFPFGGGSRRCIGYALALLEMKLVLAKILTQWDLNLANDLTVLPKRRGATIAPHNGVPLILKGKRAQPVSQVESIV